MTQNPPSKAHGEHARFTTCKFPNLKKKFLAPPKKKSWLRPCSSLSSSSVCNKITGILQIVYNYLFLLFQISRLITNHDMDKRAVVLAKPGI